jgi:hypothetical protein
MAFGDSGRAKFNDIGRYFMMFQALRERHSSSSASACCASVCVLLGSFAISSVACAAPTVALTGRDATIYLSTMSGGVGTANVAITPSPDLISTQSLAPSFLQIAGSDTASAVDGSFSATIVGNWNLQQNYALADTGSGVLLSASGSIAVNGGSSGSIAGTPSTGPFSHYQYNYQELKFSLSQETPFSVAGTTWGGEYLQVRQADGATYGGFDWPLTYGASNTPASWSFSGILAAGDYTISNRQVPLGNSGWNYALTFQGAQIAAVPEPQTYALMLAGFALVGFAARKRGT